MVHSTNKGLSFPCSELSTTPLSYIRNRRYGDKGRWVKYWACLGCWISPCYSPFSLGARFWN